MHIDKRLCIIFPLELPHHGMPKTVENIGSNIRYNKINMTFSDWVIVKNIISDNVIITFLGMIFSTITRPNQGTYYLDNIPCLFLSKGDIFLFSNLINSKLISELVSIDKTVFLCNIATQVRRILISITFFFAHVQLQNSVDKALNTIRNITQTSKETNWWSFDELLAGCLENVINL